MAMLIELLRENGYKPTTVRLPDWEDGRVMTVFAQEFEGQQYVDSQISYTSLSQGCLPYHGQLHNVAPMSNDYVRCAWPERKGAR